MEHTNFSTDPRDPFKRSVQKGVNCSNPIAISCSSCTEALQGPKFESKIIKSRFKTFYTKQTQT